MHLYKHKTKSVRNKRIIGYNLLIINNRRTPGESKLRLESIQRQLFRLRDKQYHERPKTDKELQKAFRNPQIFKEYGKTLNEKFDFYMGSKVNKNYSFHVFASLTTIDLIKKHIGIGERNYLMDATFKIVPAKHQQLLIISIEYKNDVSTTNRNVIR